MSEEIVVPSAPSSVPRSSLLAAPASLTSSSPSSGGLDGQSSSADSRTRKALEARLDVTNVAAKSGGSGTQAAGVITCTVSQTSGKPSAVIGSVALAELPLTVFHSPNATSVIDAVTNNPLPNAANKDAAARLQEQLMFGAAQRIPSAPSSMKPAPRGGPGGALAGPSSAPDVKLHRQQSSEASGRDIHSHSAANGSEGAEHYAGISSPGSGRVSSVHSNTHMQHGTALAAGSVDSRISSPPGSSRVTSPPSHHPKKVSTYPSPADSQQPITNLVAAQPPQVMLPSGQTMGMAAVNVQGPPQGPIPTAPVFTGQQMAVAAENHTLAMAPYPVNAQAPTPANHVPSEAQHRPVYPYFVDAGDAMQNGFAPAGMYVGVSSSGQFIPQGMAVCAPPIMQPAPGSRPLGPRAAQQGVNVAVAAGGMQPMNYLTRAIMMPVQLDGSSAPQYYYPDLIAHHMKQMIQQPPTMVAPRVVQTPPPAASSEPTSGRHSQATSPTASPLPGILRKRNHDGSRKTGGGSSAITERNSSMFYAAGVVTPGGVAVDSRQMNGENHDMGPAMSESSSCAVPAGRPTASVRSNDYSSSRGVSLPTTSVSSVKALHSTSSRAGFTPHPSSSPSTVPVATTVKSVVEGSLHGRSHAATLAVRPPASSVPEISPRKKPRKQTVVVNEDPLSSNVPLAKLLPGDVPGGGSGHRLTSSHPASNATVTPVQPAPKPKKESIHQFPYRRRMAVAYGGGYVVRGRTALNHFVRGSDVRIKEEKKLTLSEVVARFNQAKDHKELLNGCHLQHFITNIDRVCEVEREKADRYFARLLDKKWKDDPDLEEEVEGIVDLQQGNVVRSKALIEQLTEVKQSLLKMLEHRSKVQDVIARHGSQKSRKKASNT